MGQNAFILSDTILTNILRINLTVQFTFNITPLRQKLVHITFKYAVVALFQKMHQFMHYYILQALFRLFGKLQVDTDIFTADVTGTPACLHIPDSKPAGSYTDDPFPFKD
jgi:hypothetical protein